MQKKKYMKRMLVMATLGVTMALGTVGMTAEAAAQTDKAQTNGTCRHSRLLQTRKYRGRAI